MAEATAMKDLKYLHGVDLKEWRKRHGYTQEAFMMALGIGSRQTVVNWEKSAEVLPRAIQLALWALEHIPEARHVNGKRVSAAARKRWKSRRA